MHAIKAYYYHILYAVNTVWLVVANNIHGTFQQLSKPT